MYRSISSSSEADSGTTLPAKQLNSPTPARLVKRKRDDVGSHDLPTQKLAKKRTSKNSKAGDDEGLDLEQGLNTAIGNLDSRLLADYVAQRQRRFGEDLSSVEMEDRYIPEKAFEDTSDWGKPRILSDLPDFLDRFCRKPGQTKKMSSASTKFGAPHTIVVTSAGLRAANITRVLRTFQTKDAIVAKLFAKHIKLADAINYVKKTRCISLPLPNEGTATFSYFTNFGRMGIGVGTPTRIIGLLNAGALSSENLERVVVDCSYIDRKKRGIFDMRETQRSLIDLLNRDNIKSRYGVKKDGITLLLY